MWRISIPSFEKKTEPKIWRNWELSEALKFEILRETLRIPIPRFEGSQFQVLKKIEPKFWRISEAQNLKALNAKFWKNCPKNLKDWRTLNLKGFQTQGCKEIERQNLKTLKPKFWKNFSPWFEEIEAQNLYDLKDLKPKKVVQAQNLRDFRALDLEAPILKYFQWVLRL